jgi:single-strand selective monofunctional uracil DNA glycosylase
MEASGKNRTPDKLPVREREPLFTACDEALRAVCAHLRPRHVIGVGAFARERAEEALADRPFRIGTILHPSPASPTANKGWAVRAEKELAALGIEL